MRAMALMCVALAGILAASEAPTLRAAPQEEETLETAEGPGYAANGRRDPFVRPGFAPGPEAKSCSARGLEGVRARELALRGIVKTKEGFVALLVGPRGEAHVARVGSRLCDGSVRAIEPAGVTLEEAPSGRDLVPTPRQIQVRLHPE